jgi:hypothetical protein
LLGLCFGTLFSRRANFFPHIREDSGPIRSSFSSAMVQKEYNIREIVCFTSLSPCMGPPDTLNGGFELSVIVRFDYALWWKGPMRLETCEELGLDQIRRQFMGKWSAPTPTRVPRDLCAAVSL